MAFKCETLSQEKAMAILDEFDFGLIYEISEKKLLKQSDFSNIKWEECVEARIFSETGEIHVIREDESLKFIYVEDGSDQDVILRSYQMAERFRDLGRYFTVKEYLKRDRDGQMYVALTRLCGIIE